MFSPQRHPPGTRIDPNMERFLLEHPAARSVVYGMMRNAAMTGDDSAMVEWYKPVEAASRAACRCGPYTCACRGGREVAQEAYRQLTTGVRVP